MCFKAIIRCLLLFRCFGPPCPESVCRNTKKEAVTYSCLLHTQLQPCKFLKLNAHWAEWIISSTEVCSEYQIQHLKASFRRGKLWTKLKAEHFSIVLPHIHQTHITCILKNLQQLLLLITNRIIFLSFPINY